MWTPAPPPSTRHLGDGTDTTRFRPRASLAETIARWPLSATEQSVEWAQEIGQRQQFTLRGVPYGLTGLPMVYYSVSTGWNIGALVHWVDWRRPPYRYRASVRVQHST